MSKARRGRDNRALPTVDVSSEALEVERRRYHERIRAERAVEETRTKSARSARSAVEQALEEAAPRLERQGWKVTREER
jgi:3',5'-cyclic AMP phosphodiesterase CpdA